MGNLYKEDYKDFINKLKSEWVGKKVIYKNQQFTVVDVDYNGMLLIDKKARFTNTTAVDILQVK